MSKLLIGMVLGVVILFAVTKNRITISDVSGVTMVTISREWKVWRAK